MGNNETTLFPSIYLADVGIFVCCLMSIACRVKIFIATKTLNKYDVFALMSSSVKYHLTTPGFSHDYFENELNSTKSAASVKKDLVMSSSSGGNGGGLYSNINVDCSAAGIKVDDRCELDSTCAHFVTNNINHKEKIKEEHIPIGRLLRLPLTLRIIVLVNCLSVISNCLTSYLRLSQVIYAFLVFFVDMLLYAVAEPSPVERRKYNNNSEEGEMTLPLFFSTSQHSPAAVGGGFSASLVNIGVNAGLTVKPKKNGFWYFFTPKRKSFVNPYGKVEQKEDKEPSLSSPNMIENSFKMTSKETCGDDKFSRGYEINNDMRGGKFLFMRQFGLYFFDFCGLFFLFLICIFVLFLVVFRLHHLFCWVGTIAGYLACCGTLYVIGCNLGMLWIFFDWPHAVKHSSHSLYLLQSLLLEDANRRRYFGAASLPSLIVFSDYSLSVLYIMQLLLSFGCFVFYFLMLLEEGKELYRWHVEFVRWYVAIVGQAFLEILRLFVFWHLTRLGSSQERNNLYRLIYHLDSLSS